MPLIPAQTTIFEYMSARAVAHDAINLGQGFPDGAGPDLVRAAAAEAVLNGPHHYPRMRGTDDLRGALARFYRDTQGLDYDPAREIVVTSGATEALASAILGLIKPGDGALILEPAYDAYAPLVRRAGGEVSALGLVPPEWAITRAGLEAAVRPNTRLLILNDPVNPTGRMLSSAERAILRDFCLAHDLIILADEVWEEVRPQDQPHISLAADPMLRDRVIKIGSAGKIFQVTGWKIGWALAPEALATRVAATHQFLTFTTAPALQAAVAKGLDEARDWLPEMRSELAQGRARLAQGLEDIGYCVLPGAASWFLTVDLKASGIDLDDMTFCTRLVEAHGVAAIPVSAFAETPQAKAQMGHVVRFCHAKNRETIEAALARLAVAYKALARSAQA